jgi:hypothetical protein
VRWGRAASGFFLYYIVKIYAKTSFFNLCDVIKDLQDVSAGILILKKLRIYKVFPHILLQSWGGQL